MWRKLSIGSAMTGRRGASINTLGAIDMAVWDIKGKAEVTMNRPYAHDAMHEPYEHRTRVVEAVRKTLGPDIALMVDVQYMWPDAETAIRTVRDWAECDLFFLETPIWIDKLDDHARPHEEAPMKIAAGLGAGLDEKDRCRT